ATGTDVALQPAVAHRFDEGRIVALALISVCNGVVSDRLVEFARAAQIPSDHGGIARFGVRAGQRQTAERSESPQHPWSRGFDGRRNLHVAQLTDIEVAALRAPRPAQEAVAR